MRMQFSGLSLISRNRSTRTQSPSPAQADSSVSRFAMHPFALILCVVGTQSLGRCHAVLNEHLLSVAALDSAIQVAQTGELLFSEALTVRARALIGKAAPAGGPHWTEYTGKQRLVEVMGRMAGDRELLEKLLLHGLRDGR